MRTEADAIVLGAGVSGLTAARALRQEHEHVVCLDAFPHAGGNHRSRNIGDYTFDIGSIVFNREHPLFRYFDGVLELCVPFNQQIQRIAPDSSVRAYPFEMKEAMGRSPIEAIQNGLSLVAGRVGLRSPGNVEEVCIHLLGKRLYEGLGLKVYIERFYGLPAQEINLRFAEQRMQFITKKARLDRMAGALVQAAVGRFFGKPHLDDIPFAGLARPRSGFAHMYGAAQADLAGRGVEFGFSVEPLAIRAAGSDFVVETSAGTFKTRRIINTIPVNDVLKLLGRNEMAGLRSSDLLTLYVSFEGKRGFHAPILYNFDAAGPWKRLTMHSHAYGLVEGREYFSLEFPFMKADVSQVDALFTGFVAHARKSGAFDGDLRLEGFDLTPKAYPAYTIGSDELLESAIGQIEGFGLETVGRQGRFDYLPTVLHVMEQVEREMEAGRARRKGAATASSPVAA